MSLKHRLPELEASIDPAALRAAADEYSDLLLTLCLCMKMAGPTRENLRACATELKKRLTTWHSQKELNAILSSWDPVELMRWLDNHQSLVERLSRSICSGKRMLYCRM